MNAVKNHLEIPLVAMRLAIGWHFLYEGVWKLMQPGWSAQGFLHSSEWFAGPLFKALAASQVCMFVVDWANMLGLTAIGLGLLAGVLTRAAAASGIVLLGFYYVCQPPFLNVTPDAHYLFLDMRVMEALALAVLVACPGPGLGDWIHKFSWRSNTDPEAVRGFRALSRREWLGGLASLGSLGVFGGLFARWKWGPKSEVVTSATAQAFTFTGLDKLTHPIAQYGQIGTLKLSRLILGGGMISGYAHPRDLKYLSGPNGLMKAYNTPDRVRNTLGMAEKVGINTIIINPLLIDTVTDYWKRCGGKIQFITNCGYHGARGDGPEKIAQGLVDGARMSVERGAASCFMRGEYTDDMATNDQRELFANCLKQMKTLGVPIGIGCHEWKTVKYCVEHEIIPDYWMLTFNSRKYWSATPEFGINHDNCWCTDPEGLKAYMATVKQPWIAFKVLGAGAIHPREGFPYAYGNGADFVCAGMFDFQMVENVNIVNKVFEKGLPARPRPWHG